MGNMEIDNVNNVVKMGGPGGMVVDNNKGTVQMGGMFVDNNKGIVQMPGMTVDNARGLVHFTGWFLLLFHP